MIGGAQVPGPEDDDEPARGDGPAGGLTDAERLRIAEEHADGPGEPGAPRPTDPRAAAVVAALDRTRADLAAEPAPTMPPHVLARIDRALAAEPARRDRPGADQDPEPGTEPGTEPGLRRERVAPRRVLRRPAVLAAAAAVLAVVVGVVVAVSGGSSSPGPTAALPPPSSNPTPSSNPAPGPSAPPTLRRDDPVAALRSGLGGHDGGPLTAPERRGRCLAAHGLPPATLPLGERRVVLDGTPGVLFVLPTGVAGRFRLLVVGDDCTDGVPSTVADTVVGR